MDGFDRLPDSLILQIFDSVSDVKTLIRCRAVSKRFNSLVPQTDSLLLTVDRVISSDSDSDSANDDVSHLLVTFLKSILKSIHDLVSPRPDPTRARSQNSPAQILRSFHNVRNLSIELPSGDLRLEKGTVLKWRADFGKTLRSCVILGFRSVVAGGETPVPGDDADFAGGLKVRVVWTISALIAASARHYLLKEVVREQRGLETLVLRDREGEGVVVMEKEGLRECGREDTPLDCWDGIALEYSVDWPLQLFFTPDVLSKYCRVFQYLLRLKRTQMELEKSWASVMHQDHTDFAKHRNDHVKGSVSQQGRQRSRPMWRIREHMAFLIRNLQFYIQVDVIESQWNVLQAHIQDSNDFTGLVGVHQEYLSALISQSFLDIGSLSRILDSIMKLCLQFCWNIENQESSANTSELEHIIEEFNKKSNSLYTILRSSRLVGSQRAPFLRRFLMRLNFNSFFEATAKGVLNVVRPRPTLSVLNQQ